MFFLGNSADLALVTFLASFLLLIAVILACQSAIDYTINTLKS
jgi:hypothetical protein